MVTGLFFKAIVVATEISTDGTSGCSGCYNDYLMQPLQLNAGVLFVEL